MDGTYQTSDFQEAIYLYKSGIIFQSVIWDDPRRATFVFKQPSDEILSAWQCGEDGGVRVLNRGYSDKERKWKEAEGKGYFVHGPDQGYLKVSFFGPFYGSYIVFELDHADYQYALVCGPDKSYLWILSRSPELRAEIRDRLIAKAAALGFDTGGLIFVDHR